MSEVVEEEDRISRLPDEMLSHILTYLDSDVAVRTSLLSKRWVNLWTTLPCLKFRMSTPFTDYDNYDFSRKFIANFLKYRNQDSILSTIKVDCIGPQDEYIATKCVEYAITHNVEHLGMRGGFYEKAPCLKSDSIKTLHLSWCGFINTVDDWVLPSLTSLKLYDIWFGDHISGFENLKELTLSGCHECFLHFEKDFSINCPNLERLALGSDISHCDMVVVAPKLLYFEFRSGHVPKFSAGDGFPCIKEVVFHIDLKYDDGVDLQHERMTRAMLNFISMLGAVRETRVLKLSSKTIQFIHRVPELWDYQPAPLRNLKVLGLQGLNEISSWYTYYVLNYLLSNSPLAEILEGHFGRNQKILRFDY